VVTTDKTTGSRWVPWEMGFMDGISLGKVVILPIVELASDLFKGGEFFGIYPIVGKEYAFVFGKDVPYVKLLSGDVTKFDQFVKD
jgi:hypothetical protein